MRCLNLIEKKIFLKPACLIFFQRLSNSCPFKLRIKSVLEKSTILCPRFNNDTVTGLSYEMPAEATMISEHLICLLVGTHDYYHISWPDAYICQIILPTIGISTV